MKCNVGGWDRTWRLTSGAVLLAVGLFGPLRKRGRTAALSLGATQLLTGLTRYCPVNQALGIDTCELVPRVARKAMEALA